MLNDANENSSISADIVDGPTHGYSCNMGCSGGSCGWYCAVKALAEGAMNY